MERIKVYLDFDGTIVNTSKVAIDYFNFRFGTNFKVEDLKRYNFSDLFPNITKEEISELFNGDYLFENLECIKDCYDVLYGLRNGLFVNVVSLCSEENYRKKISWISRNFKFFDRFTYVPLSNGDKSDVDMSDGILIDDNLEFLRKSNAKVKILFRNNLIGDWNNFDNLDEIYVLDTWEEIGAILKFYIRTGEII